MNFGGVLCWIRVTALYIFLHGICHFCLSVTGVIQKTVASLPLYFDNGVSHGT